MSKEANRLNDTLKLFVSLGALGLLSFAAVDVCSNKHYLQLLILNNTPNKKGEAATAYNNYVKIPTGAKVDIGLFKRNGIQSAFSIKDNPPNKKKKKHSANVYDAGGNLTNRLTKKNPEAKILDGDVIIKFKPKVFKESK